MENPKQAPRNHLTIKVGEAFEASAGGPLGILALLALLVVYGIGRYFGLW